MKKRLSALLLLTPFLLFASIRAYGQINPHPGYIVTNENDTISGTLDLRTSSVNSRQCTFRAMGENGFKTYSPGEVKAYRFEDDGTLYVSRNVEVDGKKREVFLEYLVKGIVSLYYLPLPMSEYYLFEDEAGNLTVADISDADAEMSAEEARRHRNTYLRPLFGVFQKSKKIQKRLVGANLTKEELAHLTKEYHQEVCKDAEACIQFVHKKKVKTLQIKVHATAGVVIHNFHSKEMESLWHFGNLVQAAPVLSVGVDLHMPRLSRNFYPQIMLSLSRFDFDKSGDVPSYSQKKPSIKAFVTDLLIGGAYSLGDKWFLPTIQAGISATMFNGLKTGEYLFTFENPERKNQAYFGGYAGMQWQYKLKKGALQANGRFKYRKNDIMRLQTIEVGVGYCF